MWSEYSRFRRLSVSVSWWLQYTLYSCSVVLCYVLVTWKLIFFFRQILHLWLFKLRLVFTYQQEKLSIIWNVGNTYGHVLLAYSGGFHMHRYSEGRVIVWTSSKNWLQADQLLHAFQIHFKENHFMASEVVKRRAMSRERNWNLFWTLSSSTKREQNNGVMERAEFEKISLDAFFLAACSFVLLFVLLPQVRLHFLLRLLTYLIGLCGQETISSRGP